MSEAQPLWEWEAHARALSVAQAINSNYAWTANAIGVFCICACIPACYTCFAGFYTNHVWTSCWPPLRIGLLCGMCGIQARRCPATSAILDVAGVKFGYAWYVPCWPVRHAYATGTPLHCGSAALAGHKAACMGSHSAGLQCFVTACCTCLRACSSPTPDLKHASGALLEQCLCHWLAAGWKWPRQPHAADRRVKPGALNVTTAWPGRLSGCAGAQLTVLRALARTVAGLTV